jgi:hypothetical protein
LKRGEEEGGRIKAELGNLKEKMVGIMKEKDGMKEKVSKVGTKRLSGGTPRHCDELDVGEGAHPPEVGRPPPKVPQNPDNLDASNARPTPNPLALSTRRSSGG